MAGTDARSLVARLNRQPATLREREILAPLPSGGRIHIRLDGLIHTVSRAGAV